MFPPLSQQEQLQVAQLKAKMATADADKAAELVSNLDPAGTLKKRLNQAREDTERIVDKVTTVMTFQKNSIRDIARAIEVTEKSAYPLERYRKNMEEKKKKYIKENTELEHTIRANRRRFLDSDPQVGTDTLFGFRTSDDKVMLGFWIILILFVSIVTYTMLTLNQKMHNYKIYLIANGVAIFAAYLFIYYRSYHFA